MRHRRPAPVARHGARPAEERSLSEPRYVGSFPSADVPLDPPFPEVALVGRSNVGKSSLVNALAGHAIARVSASPGKTRVLNVYLFRGAVGGRADRARATTLAASLPPLYLLDLPGYGYARASKAERTGYRRLIRDALARPRLAGVLWLLDIRHAPSTDDRAIHGLLAGRGVPVLATVTKSDRLSRSARQGRAAELGAALALDDNQLIVTSVRAGEGIGELREALAGLVGTVAGGTGDVASTRPA